MDELKASLRRIRGSRAFLPMAIGLGAAVLILLFAGGVAIYQNTATTKTVKNKAAQGGTTTTLNGNGIAYDSSGKVGTLYQIDGSADDEQKPYGASEALESGYDTSNLNTGTASRLQELQDQIDYMGKNQQESTNTAVENSMRGEVDYDAMNKAVSESADSLNASLDSYKKIASADSQSLRNTIASNKNDTDAKIKSLENQIKNASSSESTLTSTVKDNYNTTTKKISDLETQTNKKISDLSDSTKKQLDELKQTVGSDVNDKITNITNNITNMQSGSTAVLVGTYNSSTNTFTVKGGN